MPHPTFSPNIMLHGIRKSILATPWSHWEVNSIQHAACSWCQLCLVDFCSTWATLLKKSLHTKEFYVQFISVTPRHLLFYRSWYKLNVYLINWNYSSLFHKAKRCCLHWTGSWCRHCVHCLPVHNGICIFNIWLQRWYLMPAADFHLLHCSCCCVCTPATCRETRIVSTTHEILPPNR